MNPLQQRARGRLAGHNGSSVDRGLANIQPQVSLPLGGILSVAVKAVFREDRTDVAVEVDRVGSAAEGGTA